MDSYQKGLHKQVMSSILREVGDRNLPMHLKGGTALMLFHELDRFSEDLDFDSHKKLNMIGVVDSAFHSIWVRMDLRRRNNYHSKHHPLIHQE